MDGQKWRNRQEGFTLIEVLIAVMIFAIVIGAVYGAHQATFRVVHGSLWQLKAGTSGRGALLRLSEDLQSLVQGPAGYLRGESAGLAGPRADQLSFVSAAHVALRRDDLPLGDSLIKYTVEIDDRSGLFNLYRTADKLYPGEVGADLSAGKRHLLCSGLLGVRFSYLDSEGISQDSWESRPGEYTDQPAADSSPPQLPRLITVELHFPDQRQDEARLILTTAVAPVPFSLTIKEG